MGGRGEPRSEVDVLRRMSQAVADRLPDGWQCDYNLHTGSADRGADGTLTITAPDGVTAVLVVAVKRWVESRDVAMVRERLRRYVEPPYVGALVVAEYLSPPVRTRLAEAGLSYVDLTGNVRVSLTHPALFVSDRGADSDPRRGPGRPKATLNGVPAAKVVRALVDFKGPWTIRELARVAKVSTGSTYRVVEYLLGEELLDRRQGRQLQVADWVRLLRRWSEDYSFVGNSRVTRWIAPRGLSNLLELVAAGGYPEYAVTGTLAAAQWAPHAPARTAMIYAVDAAQAAETWELRPTEAGANVMLAEPGVDVVFERVALTEGATFAAPAQVAVDLMTGPGRSPSEAEELIEWMIRNEDSWRR